ncbi:hypothetical protein WN51_12943 [Melipona quadrifasciata]|uniref:Uncharacterized protein n=1 Tax=Melipona quadrifasciata TaxID=166423 RepID=A0A0M9AAD4_9HYME|nr:hypothetical protein WN51_12943 [Melipona quadrifasciata]
MSEFQVTSHEDVQTFPSKIVELNEFVNEYMPESVKNSKFNDPPPVDRKVKCQSTLSSVKNSDLNSISDFGVSSLATCTKKIVVTPSQYIVDNIIPAFFQRRELKNAQCGPSPNWSSSLSTHVTTVKKDTTIIGKLIDIMRPAVVKLITDTTTLKRWLQAVALTSESPPIELTNATRKTKTIDCWAYELFFHLKYLQVNRARRTTDKVILEANSETESKSNDVIHANLWHRLVQLRDNYIILKLIVIH